MEFRHSPPEYWVKINIEVERKSKMKPDMPAQWRMHPHTIACIMISFVMIRSDDVG